jgi:hypothetical protein
MVAKAKPKKWIQEGKKKGTIREGGLHKTLGKEKGEPITQRDIARAKKMGGKAAKQASLAQTFKKMSRKRKGKK